MKKAVVLVVVIGVSIIIALLAFAAILIMTNEARVAEHKIRRMRATFAAQGAIVRALERLRLEGVAPAQLVLISEQNLGIGGTIVNVTVSAAPAGAPSD
ncbi:MAG: hypothetical protein KKF80_01010, partial [Candidatus Omnitrophica bacterium]|nr:hypothetical protein [Candidatus Omnitrophota bacterium]